jgi:hypothetical protein
MILSGNSMDSGLRMGAAALPLETGSPFLENRCVGLVHTPFEKTPNPNSWVQDQWPGDRRQRRGAATGKPCATRDDRCVGVGERVRSGTLRRI